jgi:hypothetical protein
MGLLGYWVTCVIELLGLPRRCNCLSLNLSLNLSLSLSLNLNLNLILYSWVYWVY